jgi:hypothetical protein
MWLGNWENLFLFSCYFFKGQSDTVRKVKTKKKVSEIMRKINFEMKKEKKKAKFFVLITMKLDY